MGAPEDRDRQQARVTARLREADAALTAAERDPSAAARTFDLVVAAALDVIPGFGAAAQRLVDAVLEQRQRHLITASRRMLDVLATVHEDVARRLETDPRFAQFTERLIGESAQLQRREKLAYYANLLGNAARADGPDEDERVRLLDVLDDLETHHLRMFHVLATTQSTLDAVGYEGDGWRALAELTGSHADAVRLDREHLIRLGLLDEGWRSTRNLRLQFTEFGLAFEEFVGGGPPDGHRWRIAIEAQGGDLATLGREFARPERDPRVVRERGGWYLVGARFEALDDATEVRDLAAPYLDLMRRAWRMDDGERARLSAGRVLERTPTGIVIHEPAGAGDLPPDDEEPPFRPPPFPLLAVDLADRDELVARVLALVETGDWESLVEAANLIEADAGGRVRGYRAPEDRAIDRFDAQAHVRGFARPASGLPAAMDLPAARTTVERMVQGWLYAKAGHGDHPNE